MSFPRSCWPAVACGSCGKNLLLTPPRPVAPTPRGEAVPLESLEDASPRELASKTHVVLDAVPARQRPRMRTRPRHQPRTAAAARQAILAVQVKVVGAAAHAATTFVSNRAGARREPM
jgi:hypothetical protein